MIPPEKLHELLTYCIDFARTMLESSGDFYPFGAAIGSDGMLGAVGGYNGDEHPNPQEIYALLAKSFSDGAREGNWLGVALAANVNIPSEYSPSAEDGLRVHLESDGYSRFIYVPYRILKAGLFKRKLTAEFDEPFSVETTPHLFVASG